MSSQEINSDHQKIYDKNASLYDHIRGNLYLYKERYSVLSHLPELQGKEVLDIACGTGLYSRLFKSLGASRVTGVDVSSEMLKLARSHEKADVDDIEYIHQDFCTWSEAHHYDLIFSAYILNYMKNRQELTTLLKNMYNSLAANGRLLIVLDILGFRRASEYGDTLSEFSIYHQQPKAPFDSFRLTLKGRSDAGGIDIFPTHIDPTELFRLLTETGFTKVQLQPPTLSDEIWDHMSISEINLMSVYPGILLVSATRS